MCRVVTEKPPPARHRDLLRLEVRHDVGIERTLCTDIPLGGLDILSVPHHHSDVFKRYTSQIEVGGKRPTRGMGTYQLPFRLSHVMASLYHGTYRVDAYTLTDASQHVVERIEATRFGACVCKEHSEMVTFVYRNPYYKSRCLLRHIRQHICLDVAITDGKLVGIYPTCSRHHAYAEVTVDKMLSFSLGPVREEQFHFIVRQINRLSGDALNGENLSEVT